MRKARFLLYVILLILLCGCTNNDNGGQINPAEESTPTSIETTTMAREETTADFNEEPCYDVYELDVANSEFNSAIKNNTIDQMYRQEISVAVTTEEMIATELKYIEIWQNELDSTAAKYKEKLSSEDAEKFDLLQRQFDAYVESSFTFDAELILQNKYDMHLGTSSKWLLYVEKREVIRERTIHIKYLHYILERDSDSQD